MGIDYSGGMIVGELVSNIDFSYCGGFDDRSQWIEDQGLARMSQYYDCELDYCYIGFTIKDTPVKDIESFVKKVKKLAEEFEKITGTPAKLIGTQDIF